LRSSWYPAHYGYAPQAIKDACQVPRSFYNYLRYHKVCPEYDEQLQEALKICDLAERELPKTYVAGLVLPGDFNKSGSVIFGGAEAGLYAGDQSWVEDMKKAGINMEQMGLRDEEAKIKFATGVAIMGTDEQDARLEKMDFKVVQWLSTGLEVVEIQLPDNITRAAYVEQSKVTDGKLGPLEPLGKLICRTWFSDDCDEWDIPKDKYPDGMPHRAAEGHTYEFWVEERLLEECFLGMKMDATIMELESGIMILDEVKQIMCSFFTWLPNELWMDRKPKELRWLAKALPDDDKDDQDVFGSDDEFEGNGKVLSDQAQAGFDDEFDEE
jgi:hypothetical protein